jgi:hypothetical protein
MASGRANDPDVLKLAADSSARPRPAPDLETTDGTVRALVLLVVMCKTALR